MSSTTGTPASPAEPAAARVPPRAAGVSRRALAPLLGTAAGAAAAVAACGAPEPGRERVSTQPVTLIWAVRGGGTPENRQKALDDYKQLRPNVTVDQIDASGGIAPSIEKIAAAMAAGTVIDVINGHLAARQLVESIDALQPIDDLAKRDKFDLGRYNPGPLEGTSKYDGKLYALPYANGGDVVAVVYNKTLFRQGGVKDPPADWSKPWTWDEFREALRRLTKTDGAAFAQVGLTRFGYWVHTAIMQWGARWLTPDYKTIVCDSQQTIDAYLKYSDLIFKDRVMGQSPGANLAYEDAFLQGKAAVHMHGTAVLTLARKTKGPNVEWGFVTMPKGTVASLDVSPIIMGVGKPSKQRADAWDLVKFLDDGSRLAILEDRIPGVLPDMAAWIKQNFSEWPSSNAEMLVEGMKTAKPLESLRYHPLWQKMVTEIIDPAEKDFLSQAKTITEILRSSKPLLQKIVDDHARSRQK
jgi:ABC-type glycerol-3-phosphate transport system substrate-binding protein